MHLTVDQLAEVLGTSRLLPRFWAAQGMPVASGETARTPRGKAWWRISRGDLAEEWRVHPDTLTDWLRQGLNAAVIERGGAGKPMAFDYRRAWRWKLGRDGLLDKIHEEDRQLVTAAVATLGRNGARA